MAIPHAEFVNKLVAAPKDISLPILQDLLNQGYDKVTWNTNAGAVDSACLTLNNESWPLADFLQGLLHEAPIYEARQVAGATAGSHVGCHCVLRVTGPDLPDVMVNAFGITS
jgi:hypothetical protein